jgi:hypothetical protein
MKGDLSFIIQLGPKIAVNRHLAAHFALVSPLIDRPDRYLFFGCYLHPTLSKAVRNDHAHLVKQNKTAIRSFPVQGRSSQSSLLIMAFL